MSKLHDTGGFIGASYTYPNVPPVTSIVTSGLILNLDAGNTTSYPGTGTTWFDLSGNALNGTLSSVTYTSGSNGYFTFDGLNSIVDCGTSGSFYSGNLTIEAMIYPVTGGEANFGRIVDRSAASTVGYILLLDTTGSSGINSYRYINYATGEIRTDNQISFNAWQHIVATQSGATATTYKNAVQIGTNAAMSNPPAAGTANFYIGNRAALDRTFNGRIAIVRFYNRALSQAEIEQNYYVTKSRYGLA